MTRSTPSRVPPNARVHLTIDVETTDGGHGHYVGHTDSVTQGTDETDAQFLARASIILDVLKQRSGIACAGSLGDLAVRIATATADVERLQRITARAVEVAVDAALAEIVRQQSGVALPAAREARDAGLAAARPLWAATNPNET